MLGVRERVRVRVRVRIRARVRVRVRDKAQIKIFLTYATSKLQYATDQLRNGL